jgi:hypothetical protein
MRKPLSIYSYITGRHDRNLFHIWLTWLLELGGEFLPYVGPGRKPVTGRRNPDTKPRQYELNPEKYGMDPKTGSIWRRR